MTKKYMIPMTFVVVVSALASCKYTGDQGMIQAIQVSAPNPDYSMERFLHYLFIDYQYTRNLFTSLKARFLFNLPEIKIRRTLF